MFEFVVRREDFHREFSSEATSEYRLKFKEGDEILFIEHPRHVSQEIVERALEHMWDHGCFDYKWWVFGAGKLGPAEEVSIYEVEEEEAEEVSEKEEENEEKEEYDSSDSESYLYPSPRKVERPKYKVVLTAPDPNAPDPLEIYVCFYLSSSGDLIETDDETFKVCGSEWL